MSKETRAMRRRRGRSHDEAFERCRRSIGNVDGYEELCRTAFHFFTERNDELDGLRHGLVPLHADHWHAPESHAHEMTAVTTYLLGGRGGYRVTSGTPGTTIYLVIMAAQWVG